MIIIRSYDLTFFAEAMVNLLESPRVDTVINAAKALAKLGITGA